MLSKQKGLQRVSHAEHVFTITSEDRRDIYHHFNCTIIHHPHQIVILIKLYLNTASKFLIPQNEGKGAYLPPGVTWFRSSLGNCFGGHWKVGHAHSCCHSCMDAVYQQVLQLFKLDRYKGGSQRRQVDQNGGCLYPTLQLVQSVGKKIIIL